MENNRIIANAENTNDLMQEFVNFLSEHYHTGFQIKTVWGEPPAEKSEWEKGKTYKFFQPPNLGKYDHSPENPNLFSVRATNRIDVLSICFAGIEDDLNKYYPNGFDGRPFNIFIVRNGDCVSVGDEGIVVRPAKPETTGGKILSWMLTTTR